jgi:hypothetical protein
MRRLAIVAVSSLVLLCVPYSTPQSCGLHSIRWTSLTIVPFRIMATAATSLRQWVESAPSPASERGAAPSAQESISLEPSNPIERELSGGSSRSYKITMSPGQYLHVVVAQRGIDVAVVLSTPDGKKIIEADSEEHSPLRFRVMTVARAETFLLAFQPLCTISL